MQLRPHWWQRAVNDRCDERARVLAFTFKFPECVILSPDLVALGTYFYCSGHVMWSLCIISAELRVFALPGPSRSEICGRAIGSLTLFAIPLKFPPQLVVVVSSLVTKNPALALSNTLGSSTANILGSFSIGLVFADFTTLASPASSLFRGSAEGRMHRSEKTSERIYTSALVVLTLFIAFIGPLWEYIQAKDRRKHGKPVHAGIGAGRWVGILLVSTFVFYIACIAYGIYRGVLVAPEGSDSDTSDSSEGDTTDSAEEDAMEDDTTFEYRVAAGNRDRRRARNAQRAGEWTGTSKLGKTHMYWPFPATESAPLLPPQRALARRKSTFQIIYRLVISTLLLSVSGYILSATAASLAEQCHLSETTVGLTLLSIGTTLPEKLVAYKSARKGQRGVLIANTVGSNIFLQTLVLGVIWIAKGHVSFGIAQGNGIWVDVAVVLASSLALWVVVWFGLFRKWIGVTLFVAYVGYIASVVATGRMDLDWGCIDEL
jgi:Ca2+/Na+ antiporter